MTRALRAAAAAGAVAFSLAHVGSPDTLFEGRAGPYPVRVIVRAPGVVPGLADIAVRFTLGPERVRTVTVLPLRGGVPTAANPPPDTARPVAGDPSLYAAQLWLMAYGAYSVEVRVAGTAGDGVAIVPVNSVATRRLEMRAPVALALAAAGLFLFVGMLTIVGAAVRESVLPPGESPDPRRRRRARWATAATVPALALLLLGGNAWWDAEDRAYRRRLYRPPGTTTTLDAGATGLLLRLAVDSTWLLGRQRGPLIPDHGKMMHLFLVRGEAPAALAHLHPAARDSVTFETAVPPVPAGRYFLYADVVHESGFTQTLTDTVDVPPSGPRWQSTDPDDSWWMGGPDEQGGQRATGNALADGSVMTWKHGDQPLVAGKDATLEFEVTGPDGRPAALEPYMGMPSHAVVARDDGRVFVHLHALGTVSAAAQRVYEVREPGDTVRGALAQKVINAGRGASESAPHPSDVPHPTSHALTFPYAFPEPGAYRIWVQVKRRGRVLTGAFLAEVEPGP